ncbi:MAG TPA: hypothetical protein VHG91_06890 [Longimicrobium sp.]|nr:hypothetical protein [Longimicrobium sp.]
MKPCRDCNTPVSPAARACPHCGILNPVNTWVAYPDGSHLTHRVPPAERGPAPAVRPAVPAASAPAAGPGRVADLQPVLAGGRPVELPASPAAARAAAFATLEKKSARSKERGFAQLFQSVGDAEEARDAVRICGDAFLVLAVLQALLALLFLPALLVNAVVVGGLGFWLRQGASRWAALGLLLFTGLRILDIVVGFTTGSGGGGSIYLTVVMFALSLRAFKATLFLQRETALA